MADHINHFNQLLQSFHIKASCQNYNKINNYSYYDVILQQNSQISHIKKYLDEISLALKAYSKPEIKLMREHGTIRLEFISPRTNRLNLFDYFIDNPLEDGLNCLLGESLDGKPIWMDLSQNPHMIVSGTTGSGKSVLLHNLIANLLHYHEARIFLLDAKNVEFIDYNLKKIRSIGSSYSDATNMLDFLIDIMQDRYSQMRKGVDKNSFPYVVLIIDEFAELIMQDQRNQFRDKLCKLAQTCRAAKIHIILSTQRPSADVINGTIKANFPARIACKVSTAVDSKVALGAMGAEKLLGAGDALLKDNFRFDRFQVAYTTSKEVCQHFA